MISRTDQKRYLKRGVSVLRFATAFGIGRAELVLRPRNRSFRGAYPTHAAAMAAVPRGFDAGYSNDVSHVAFEIMSAVAPWDYPILYWMRHMQDEVRPVLDFGGHMGTKFRAFDPYLSLSNAVDWTIFETPPMVAAGLRQAEADGLSDKLHSTSDPSETSNIDLLLASGVFQYFDGDLSDILALIRRKPEHVLLNKVALRNGRAVFTLERIGGAYVPYQFRSRDHFLSDIASTDYEIVDEWMIPSLSHTIRSHPEYGASHSMGFYLKRRADRERISG